MTRKINRNQEILQEAGDQDAPGRGIAGAGKKCRQRQRRYHRKIEQHRGCSRARKSMLHVEHAAIQRHQRDQQQIGKGDAREFDRQMALRRLVGEARRQDAHGLGHEQPGGREQDQLRQKQKRENAIGKQARRRLSALAGDMGIGRHEGGVEGAFGKNRTEMIGQPERDEKRVRHWSRAQDRGQHDVAGKAGQPRKQRVTADGEDAS